jgi:hypothetical protein
MESDFLLLVPTTGIGLIWAHLFQELGIVQSKVTLTDFVPNAVNARSSVLPRCAHYMSPVPDPVGLLLTINL